MINLNPEKYGYLHLRTVDRKKAAINTSATPAAAAEIADRYNTATYLRATFFEDNPSILNIHDLNSGGKVTLMIPSAPYSPESVMVVAAGARSFDKEVTPTETIYDYPYDVQKSYWTHIITGLETLEELTELEDDNDKYHVVATENCIVTRTTEKNRTSRSIALPHAQISAQQVCPP